MEWIQTLNKGINYIEEHLLQDITCDEVAKQVYISTFHFQRTFNLLTGMTVGEYIRNRRLSLAGQELTKGSAKVIEVALKYGYETPESFTKAFTRFHGITPNQAKKKGSNLKSFNPLVIKIKLEGGDIMDYKIVKKPAFKVVGKTKMFTDEKDILAFWNEYFSKGLEKQVDGAMGICSQKKTDTKEFSYSIGDEISNLNAVPDGFEVIEIPEGTWAIFTCVGAMPKAIQDMWKRVYSEWLPQAEYELIPSYDIEYYTDGDTSSSDYISEIWIPVKEK